MWVEWWLSTYESTDIIFSVRPTSAVLDESHWRTPRWTICPAWEGVL